MEYINIGTDIVEVDRIKKLFEKYNEKFLNKIYTESEKKYIASKNESKYETMAGRFAAKEAVYKVVSSSREMKKKFMIEEFLLEYKEIEIYSENGIPEVRILNKEYNDKTEGKIKIKVSISHEKNYATATALLMF